MQTNTPEEACFFYRRRKERTDMNMLKKGLAIAVTLLLAAGITTACGANSGNQTAVQTTAAPSSPTAATKATAPTTKAAQATKATQPTTKAAKTAKAKAAQPTKKSTKKTTKVKKTAGNYCYLTISCKAAVNNPDLNSSKKSAVPANGIIYAAKKVTFTKGDSVYDVLKRETRDRGIQMQSTISLGDVYIEGINNLYQFDCGSTSGWKYSVNGSFPGYSCGKYTVKAGDSIQWIFATQV